MVAVAGGSDIPLVPYATFGTKKLAQNVARGIKARNACLIANHGQITAGPTLKAALDLAFEVETLAAQYLKVLEIGKPKLLDDEEMARVLKKFQTYGRQRDRG
jgi:L-fuculose-phosphate aldolase